MTPNIPVLLVALKPLTRGSWSGRLPNVTAGEPFWAAARDAAWLIPGGYAEAAPPGTAAPPPEPAWTVHGQPGFGDGTSNSSHAWVPLPGGVVDGGGPVPPYPQSWGGVVDGGTPDGDDPAGVIDGGSP